jgi:hypothetical protein
MSEDKAELNTRVARAIYNATPRMRSQSPARRAAIAEYLRAIATTINDAVTELSAGITPHGKCGEMFGHIALLPNEIGDLIGADKTNELMNQLHQAYDIENFLRYYSGNSERAQKIGELAFAAGYYNAAAAAVAVGDADDATAQDETPLDAAILPLYTQLNDAFSLAELEDLCFQLNIDWENLRGDVKKAKARALVQYCERRGSLKALRALVASERP